MPRLPPHLLRAIPAVLMLAVLSPAPAQAQLLGTVPGEVRDLSRDAAGRLLFCTDEGDVGRIALDGTVTVLAGMSDGLPAELRAVTQTPAGDIAVAQAGGDIWVLPGGVTPVEQRYSDLYFILDVSDMIVLADGNFLLCSKTPSSNTYAINWVSADGSRWAYLLVEEAPYGVAYDPLHNDLVISDRAGSGALRRVSLTDPTHTPTVLDNTTTFGFQPPDGDGDLVIGSNGDIFAIAGSTVFRHTASTATTSPLATGFGALRGATIAASSGNIPSASGWSLYVAEGGGPTNILELGDAPPPASLVPPSLGPVPNRGRRVSTFLATGLRVFELTADNDGNLLVGGDLWGANQQVRRIDTSDFTWSVIAGESDGIHGRVEGITVARDGTIFALTKDGYVQRIDEGQTPLVTTLFDDALGQVTAGKDMALDRDGTLFLADREGYGPGEVLMLSAGSASSLRRSGDTRGLTADPFTSNLLFTIWNCAGFCGTVEGYDFSLGTLTPLPGLSRLNYTNDSVWGDGDTVIDVEGNIYSCSEDDWRVVRYGRDTGRFEILGSSYLHHPSGVAIAPSSPGSTSASGWSLYVSEFDLLWEIDDVPPPAPPILDRTAPPVGETLTWFVRSLGEPTALVADPLGDGLFVGTAAGQVVRVQISTGAQLSVYATPAGAALTALAALPNGDVVAATGDGELLTLDASSGYAPSSLWTNTGGELSDVRAITIDGQGRILIVDEIPGSEASRIHRLESGALSLLSYAAGGVAAAIDPLTADLFVPERGSASDGVGEILRIAAHLTPSTAGHWRGPDGFEPMAHATASGGIAFDDQGNFYATEALTGRVARYDRATQVRGDIAGNYREPRGLALATGTPGIAGPQGTSLFVLDGWAIYEVGVDGLPAPAAPAVAPALAPPAEFRAVGSIALSSLLPLEIESPANAGSVYLVVASLAGKVPGFPLAALGASDPRVLANNPDTLWNLIGKGASMPGSIGVLDGNGRSANGTGIFIGPSPTVFTLGRFLDLAWVAVDPGALNRIARVGATTQVYLGL